MATYSKVKLGSSTDGAPVAVAAISTPGTLIHTAHGTSIDEILLIASNVDTVDRELTIEYGGTGTAFQMVVTVPARGMVELPAMILTNSLLVRAFSDSANKINIAGAVNRIT